MSDKPIDTNSASESAHQAGKESIRERVLPNPLAMAWLLLISPICYLTFVPINDAIGVTLGVLVTIAVLVSIFFAAPVLEVDTFSFAVSNAEIPLKFISSVEVIEKNDAFDQRGPKLNPSAFVRFQATVPTMLKLNLIDPQDPTPYWLVSTRKPKTFKQFIDDAKASN